MRNVKSYYLWSLVSTIKLNVNVKFAVVFCVLWQIENNIWLLDSTLWWCQTNWFPVQPLPVT